MKLLLNRKIIKNDEKNIWSISFSLILSPKFIWFFMPKKSSIKPIKKKPDIVISKANLNFKEITLILSSTKMKRGIINMPPIVGVLFLLKCELGPSGLTVWEILYFFINLIPYFVVIVEATTENIYKIKINGFFIYIEFINVINEIIINKKL